MLFLSLLSTEIPPHCQKRNPRRLNINDWYVSHTKYQSSSPLTVKFKQDVMQVEDVFSTSFSRPGSFHTVPCQMFLLFFFFIFYFGRSMFCSEMSWQYPDMVSLRTVLPDNQTWTLSVMCVCMCEHIRRKDKRISREFSIKSARSEAKSKNSGLSVLQVLTADH